MAQPDIDIPESGPEREERIEKLYKKLDVRNKGRLDRRSLKEGLQKINHPLAGADSFLDNVMRSADLNHDGVIEVFRLPFRCRQGH
jgi:solute carrier family 25 (mitochondrial phosphate transporter), member 23/24/25/41